MDNLPPVDSIEEKQENEGNQDDEGQDTSKERSADEDGNQDQPGSGNQDQPDEQPAFMTEGNNASEEQAQNGHEEDALDQEYPVYDYEQPDARDPDDEQPISRAEQVTDPSQSTESFIMHSRDGDSRQDSLHHIPEHPNNSRKSPMDSRFYDVPQPLKVNRRGVAIIENDPWTPHSKVDHMNRGYKRSGGNVPIVDEKLSWKAKPRIEAKNPEYKRAGGQVEIHTEKLQWAAKPRVDAKNVSYKKSGGNVIIMHEKLKWRHRPLVDTRNEDYQPHQSEVMVFNDKLYWKADPKVSTRNEGYVPGNRDPVEIIDERLKWGKTAKVDHIKPYYVPGGGNVVIKSDKVDWNAFPKVATHNDAYVPHKGNVKIHSSAFDWKKNSAAKVDSLGNAEWEPAVGNVYFDPVKKRWVAKKDEENPATPRSLDSNMEGRQRSPDTLSAKGELSKPRIHKAPKGISLTELAERRKVPNAYSVIHKQGSAQKAPPHFLPPLEWNHADDEKPNNKRVVFRSKDLVQQDPKTGTLKGHSTEIHSPARTHRESRDFRRHAKKSVYQPSPAARHLPWKERVDKIDSNTLSRNFNPIRDSPIVPSVRDDWSYPDYDDYQYYSQSPAEPTSPQGYNTMRRDREVKRGNNKFSAYHQMNPIPNHSQRRKEEKFMV